MSFKFLLMLGTMLGIFELGAMQSRNQKLQEINVAERLKANKQLQNDIIRLRIIRNQLAEERAKLQIAREEQFKNALNKHNIDELRKLLQLGIDINKPLTTDVEFSITSEYPIIYAALYYANLEMVKLFLSYGAKTDFLQGSLIFIMLNVFCEAQANFENPHKYLVILNNLMSYCGFDQNHNNESRKCAKLWEKIRAQVCEDKAFNKKSLDIINNISFLFF